MAKKAKLAFHPEVLMMPVEKILPLRRVNAPERRKKRFERITSSIREIGVIEPLMIFPQNGKDGPYLLLDGTLRFEILKDMGEKVVPCLIASHDDTFTYNSRISEVTTIQEHYMIAKAIERGVSKERIASTLSVVVKDITKTEKLLDGICPEGIELLKNTTAKQGTIRLLAKVKPIRQIEMVELMSIANNYSLAYAKSLIAGTPQDLLVNPEKPKEFKGLKPEDLAMMEREMAVLGKEIVSIDETYSRNVLNLVLSASYLKRLINNARVVRFLSKNYPDHLAEFQNIVEANSLES